MHLLPKRNKYKDPVVGEDMAYDKFEELKESIWNYAMYNAKGKDFLLSHQSENVLGREERRKCGSLCLNVKCNSL